MLRGRGCGVLRLLVVLYAAVGCGWAAGPRWVTGPPYFTTAGQPVIWYTDTPQYFTDPGDLSSTVNHAAADAIVAAAAAVWNVSTSRLVLSQGGSLDEHVSGANAYLGSGGVVFPADVLPGNYLAKQIAVIYDRDGSVTDMLLGAGASDPSGCRQSAVTESVDSIVPSGFIQHAVLVLNGRCTGAAPEAQLQMQYQVMRAFGRILGMGWSQTNDNVFTGTPQPTPGQAQHWPIMHPIDVICGPYTYQCLPQPFTLRDDDLSGMAELYYIAEGQAGPGKVDSLLNANRVGGYLYFPTGQQMQGVNVVGRRLMQFTADSNVEQWDDVSSVSGFLYRRTSPTPVAAADTSMSGSMGTTNCCYEGLYEFGRVPMLFGFWQWIVVETEAVNPLYVGEYSVGPYTANTVQPSGSSVSTQSGIWGSYVDADWTDFTISDAAASCPTSVASESAPDSVDPSGWWNGVMCRWWQSAQWVQTTVRANRSLTVEVTAEGEQGFASAAKAMPVIGVWNATDPLGTLPTVAAVTEAFNGTSAGMTSLTVNELQAGGLRIAIVDQRGDVRPDFNFGARVLYADTISPASVNAGGGVVTITGMGFRPGNVVTVNGVAATVQSWTATTIVAIVPPSRARTAVVADVEVRDLLTNGTTVMTGALSYAAPLPEEMAVVSSPTGTMYVGDVAGSAFAVRVLAMDGVTPVMGEPVVFSASGAAVRFGACGAGTCTVLTDANGLASSTVTPLGAGVVTLSAVGTVASATGSFTAVVRVRTVTAVQAVEYVAAGAIVAWVPQVALTDNSGPVAGVGVSWTVVSGVMSVGVGSSVANSAGVASGSVAVGPLGGGVQAVGSACAWAGTVCAGFSAVGVGGAGLQVAVVSGAGQAVAATGALGPVVVQVTDGAGHPVAGAVVSVYQTVEPGAACPGRGRCPAEAVVEQGQSSGVSDVNGLVTVTPLQESGVAEVTNMVVTVGTQGFASLALTKGW